MGLIEKLSTRRKAAAKGANDTQKALQELRAMCARLRDQRAEIEGRPVPLAEAQDGAARAVLREAEQALADLNLSSLTRPVDGRTPSLNLDVRQMVVLAFAAQSEGVVSLLGARLTNHYTEHGLTGIAEDDRAAQITKIDAELLACECAEEAVIREMERDGMVMLRRADADPRVLLAHDSELK